MLFFEGAHSLFLKYSKLTCHGVHPSRAFVRLIFASTFLWLALHPVSAWANSRIIYISPERAYFIGDYGSNKGFQKGNEVCLDHPQKGRITCAQVYVSTPSAAGYVLLPEFMQDVSISVILSPLRWREDEKIQEPKPEAADIETIRVALASFEEQARKKNQISARSTFKGKNAPATGFAALAPLPVRPRIEVPVVPTAVAGPALSLDTGPAKSNRSEGSQAGGSSTREQANAPAKVKGETQSKNRPLHAAHALPADEQTPAGARRASDNSLELALAYPSSLPFQVSRIGFKTRALGEDSFQWRKASSLRELPLGLALNLNHHLDKKFSIQLGYWGSGTIEDQVVSAYSSTLSSVQVESKQTIDLYEFRLGGTYLWSIADSITIGCRMYAGLVQSQLKFESKRFSNADSPRSLLASAHQSRKDMSLGLAPVAQYELGGYNAGIGIDVNMLVLNLSEKQSATISEQALDSEDVKSLNDVLNLEGQGAGLSPFLSIGAKF